MVNAWRDLINWIDSIFDSFKNAITGDTYRPFMDTLQLMLNKLFYYITTIFTDKELSYSQWLEKVNGSIISDGTLSLILTILFTIFVIWFVKKIFSIFTGYLR